jgi:hypothetical protein
MIHEFVGGAKLMVLAQSSSLEFPGVDSPRSQHTVRGPGM